MSISAIGPISSGLLSATAAAYGPSSTKPASSAAAAAPAPAPAPAPAASPAATVTLSGPPASVDADDKAVYSQALRASSGNVNAAMAAVASEDKASGES
jgi:hypothetical protein